MSLQLDSKYILFKLISKLIESIKFTNNEYSGGLNDKLAPEWEYDEAAIIELNTMYEKFKKEQQ